MCLQFSIDNYLLQVLGWALTEYGDSLQSLVVTSGHQAWKNKFIQSTFSHERHPLLRNNSFAQKTQLTSRWTLQLSSISNLNFISKVLERIIHARISSHLESFSSIILPSSLHIGSFIPLKLPFFVSKMIFFLQSIKKKFQLWYLSICLPLLIRMIIKFSCPGYPLFMVSPTRHWICLLPTS